MTTKHIVQVDVETGEELRGTILLKEDKPLNTGGSFVKTYQNGLESLSTMRLTGETCRVLFFLMSRLSYDNWINVTQTEIGEFVGLKQQNVSKAIKVLVKNQIILEGPKTGRCHTYRLNYAVGYKGDESRATKGGFKELDGGKAKPRSVPSPTT